MLFIVIAFPISMLISVTIFLQEETYFLIGLDVILYLVVSITLFLKKGSMPIVPYIWLLLLYTMLITFFTVLGPHYARSAWLVMAAVMAAVFFGSRGALFATILNIIVLMILYLSIDASNLAWTDVFTEPFGKWVAFVVNVSLITIISAFPVGFLLKRLDVSLKHERNVTEKLSEETIKLKKRENKLQSIFRAAPTGIGVICDRVIQRVNDRFCEIIGYSKNELIGENARIVYPSNDEFERVGKEKYAQIQNKGTGTIETKLRRKDGKIINVLLSSTPIDSNDLSQGVIFTALDVTVSKRNEAKLLESEEKYRTMMEAQDDATYISSPDMRIEYMNPAMIQWLGKDATGRVCYEAIWGAKAQCTWCPQNKVMKGKAVTIEAELPNCDQIYQVSSSPIHHADGSISKLTSYRNITEIKQLYSRLQQAQKMESIGELAGGIAHDFNNILYPIIGYAEMLIDDLPLNSQERENAQGIMTAGKRGGELVGQILAFSRQDVHEMIPVRVQKVLKEVVKLSRSSIPANIEIKYHLQQDCGLVLADATQLHQIGMSLITNAYHAVEEKNGKIEVQVKEIFLTREESTDSLLHGGKYIQLSVLDNGCGIPPAMIDKIFEPYFTTKEKGKGTGLGLSVVYGIVKEHKGDIKVFSEVEKGTTIKLYLPVMAVSGGIESSYRQTPVGRGTERILLVDDEACYQIRSCTGSPQGAG